MKNDHLQSNRFDYQHLQLICNQLFIRGKFTSIINLIIIFLTLIRKIIIAQKNVNFLCFFQRKKNQIVKLNNNHRLKFCTNSHSQGMNRTFKTQKEKSYN